MRQAYTLMEMLIVLTVVGMLAAIAVPSASRYVDRIHVRGAAVELTTACAVARHLAIRRSARASVRLDGERGRVVVHAGADTVRVLDLASTHRVRLESTRDSIAYGPTGLGFGASTATVVLNRGRAAETLFVSRLGRVRR
jgi:prepilin-type N-terminal cleavage/methylation domain-containing protein